MIQQLEHAGLTYAVLPSCLFTVSYCHAFLTVIYILLLFDLLYLTFTLITEFVFSSPTLYSPSLDAVLLMPNTPPSIPLVNSRTTMVCKTLVPLTLHNATRYRWGSLEQLKNDAQFASPGRGRGRGLGFGYRRGRQELASLAASEGRIDPQDAAASGLIGQVGRG